MNATQWNRWWRKIFPASRLCITCCPWFRSPTYAGHMFSVSDLCSFYWSVSMQLPVHTLQLLQLYYRIHMEKAPSSTLLYLGLSPSQPSLRHCRTSLRREKCSRTSSGSPVGLLELVAERIFHFSKRTGNFFFRWTAISMGTKPSFSCKYRRAGLLRWKLCYSKLQRLNLLPIVMGAIIFYSTLSKLC